MVWFVSNVTFDTNLKDARILHRHVLLLGRDSNSVLNYDPFSMTIG